MPKPPVRQKFTHKHLSASSKAYLERQASDPFVQAAKAQGWRARAAFKLEHIQKKHHILHEARSGVGQVVVDLGCAPGSWCQMAAKICGPKSVIIGMDLLPVDPLAGVTFLEADFASDEGLALLESELPRDDAGQIAKLDVVLSDMAANTTGHKETDGIRTMALAEMAADFAVAHLKKGGHFATKLFMNGEEAKLRDRLRPHFTKMAFEKPDSSRVESREIFLVGIGFKG